MRPQASHQRPMANQAAQAKEREAKDALVTAQKTAAAAKKSAQEAMATANKADKLWAEVAARQVCVSQAKRRTGCVLV